MYLMGIDIGSTNIKAIIFSIRGELISIGRKKTRPIYKKNENDNQEIFWSPEDIWRNVAGAIRESLKKIDDIGKIKGIAVTSFGQDGVPMDEKGEILYPFISWHDTKTIKQKKDFIKKIDEYEIFKISGARPWYIHSLFRIIWIRENRPDIYKNIYKWLLLTDYINYKLSGEIISDYSESSTTLVLNQQKLKWSDKLLKTAGVNKNIFPKLDYSGKQIGEVTPEASKIIGLKVGTPVVLGGHDNNCSAFASGGFLNGSLVSITGTFESNMLFSNLPIINKDSFKNNLTCEKSVIKDKYLLLGGLYAGGILEWFDKIIFKSRVFNKKSIKNDLFYLLDSLKNSIKIGSNGIFMLPHLIGNLCPNNDEKSLGLFIGLSEKVKLIDFISAIIESINYQSLLVCETLIKVRGLNFKEVINVGGGSYNSFWMQNKADIFGRNIKVPQIKESTALGAALLAGIGVGVYKDYEDAINKVITGYTIYEPNGNNHKVYKKYYKEIYLNLYDLSRKINHKISDEFQ